ncbi:hypothetical protein ACFPJ1_40510 [Kribbella qitaiheensis]|uniref:hypothetical protein n=1 Tax=Kribbella qitaiheensis TaxID=1544730 RepID=UPI003623042C
MTRAQAALSLAGGALGGITLGLPIGAWLARKWLSDQPAKTYRQDDAVTTSLSNLKGATR